jgi:branched-chain amino acid transport system ATP-binding protein
MSRPILEVRGLTMRFGGLLAVNGVGLSVQDKQVVSMIGPNGAGKTTVFNCLTGFYQPTSGEILLDGEAIHGLPGHKIARKGVVRTFQNVRLFKDMTAVENLLVAQHRHLNTNFLSGLLKTKAFRQSEHEAMDFAAHWLEQVNLTEVANRPAGTLAYGQQRRLEIARCMMTRPRILMLDEPAAGLNPRETEDLKALIGMLRDTHDVTVLLIEHDMKLVMSMSDPIVVINQGCPRADGTPEQMRDTPDVIKAYLGEA